MDNLPSLFARFPALLRLGRFGRAPEIPVIQQLSATDCGAACLAMVLAYYGKIMRLDVLRDAAGVGRDGASARALLDTARHYGLQGRGVRIETEDFEYLPTAAILHWEFNHFVVFERMRDQGMDILDPAAGRRHISMEEVRRAFTGIALVLEPGDAFEPETTVNRPIWRYVRQVVRSSDVWLRSTLLSMMLQVFALALPVLTSSLVDRVIPRADHHLLTILSVGLASLLGFNLLATLVRGHLLLQLRTQLDLRMTLGFLDHLVSLPYAFFQRRLAGDLLMRINSHATIREILTSSMLSGLLDGVLVLIYLLILWLISPAMGLLVLVLGALQLGTFLLSRKRQRDLMSENLQIQARSEAYQVEMIAGIQTLKAAGSEQRSIETWTDLFVDTLNVALKRGRLAALVDAFTATLRMGSPLVILGWGGTQVLEGAMSLGTMLGANALAAGFLGPLGSLVTTAGQLQTLSSYVDRIDDVLAAEREQDDSKVRDIEQLSGRIELEHVTFRYSSLAAAAVDDVSLRIEPGQFVAVVGPSGSGKSTLANLLLGLYRPTSGRILFDAADLSELNLRSVRRRMGIVVQRPYLFGTTLRANIALAEPDLPLERIIEAANVAQIHGDIAAMPMGYDTPVIGGGSSLSGGQQQRIALARALVHRPAVLLLDEATSALDAVTERKVQDALATLQCTRIVIAHRLSTVMQADLILVMVDGRIVEQGRHFELLAQDGVYRTLVNAQLAKQQDAAVA